jgi:pimeloyl-ACP methyl ester carboxylesterase
MLSPVETLSIGDGAPRALVIHGNDLAGPFYRGLGEALAERGIASQLATLPGFHRVPPLANPGWPPMVDLVEAALPHPQTILVGHSMGGLLALLVAARRPPALAHLVLLEPLVLPSRWLARAAGRGYLRSVVRGDRSRFENWNGAARRVHDPDRYPRAMIDLYLEVRQTSDRATAEALFGNLADTHPIPVDRIAAPTLLIEGAEAGWRGRALRRGLRRKLRPEYRRIAGAAHWIANEADDQVARAIAELVG